MKLPTSILQHFALPSKIHSRTRAYANVMTIHQYYNYLKEGVRLFDLSRNSWARGGMRYNKYAMLVWYSFLIACATPICKCGSEELEPASVKWGSYVCASISVSVSGPSCFD